MVAKKKVIEELQKYNKELEKHLTGISISSVTDFSKSNDEIGAEYLTLFASNLSDLRTEVALLRKNISSEVEGIAINLMKQEQKAFLTQLSTFQSRMLMDMKSSFGNYVEEISSQMVNIQKEFNKISKDHGQFMESTASLNEFFKNGDVKILLEFEKKFDKMTENFNSTMKNVDSRIHKIEVGLSLLNETSKEKFDNYSKQISNTTQNTKQNNNFESDSISKVESDMAKISRELSENLLNLERQVSKISRDEELIKKSLISSPSSPLNNHQDNSDRRTLEDMRVEVIGRQNFREDVSQMPTSERIINIDSKLRKLELLR